MTSSKSVWQRLWPVILIILIGTGLRFYRLDFQSLWNDEGNSVRLAERSLALIIAGAGGDIHPPGYYILLSFWRSLVGQSAFAMRAFSAFAGVLLIAVTAQIGKRQAGWLAGLFVAVNPLLIYYSQEMRMYALEALWAGLLLWVTARWWQTGRRQYLVLSCVFTVAGLYTHYSFPFVLAAINLIALIAWGSGSRQVLQLGKWIGAQFIALLCFLPWLPIALRQITTWPSSGAQAAFTDAFIGTGRWLSTGDFFYGHAAWLILSLITLGLGLSAWRKSWIYALAFGVPCALMLGLGLFQPLFAKFLVVAVPGFALTQAIGLSTLAQRRTQRWLIPIGILCTLALTPSALRNLYFDPATFRDDYQGMAAIISESTDPAPAVILNAPNQWEVFTYYYPDGPTVYPVAKQRPLDFDQEFAQLQSIAAQHKTIYALLWGETAADPERKLEDWLNRNTFKVSDNWHGNVRLVQYIVEDAASLLANYGQTPEHNFNQQVALQQSAFAATQYKAGDSVPIVLEWQAQADIQNRLKLFIHVYSDPNTPPVAQLDTEPLGGLRPTDTWQPNEILIDQYAVQLPTDLAPGTYTLAIGWYNPQDGQRLATSSGDRLELTALQVTH